MEMPFGKHRGRPIEDIPTSYLKWLLTISILPDLQFAIESELSARGAGAQKKPPKELTKAVVSTWYRRLSMRFHPDHGGSKVAMQVVNEARELLEEMIQ
jgi:hypothetical protein